MAEAHAKPQHDYHLVNPSPWPLVGAIGGLTLAFGVLMYFMSKKAGDPQLWYVLPGLALVIITMFGWWRDVILEAHEGHETPVFVCNYPKQAKAFYMKENPADPRTVLCDDCLAPEGYGEIIGGSQREDDYDKLVERIKEEGLPLDAYDWYLDLRKYGTFVHSGYGLGLERTVAWICGTPHIRECAAFPRMMNRLKP